MQDHRLRILGIDPGTACVGYGVIDRLTTSDLEYVASGTIRTGSSLPPGARLKIIREDLLSLIDQFAPQAVAVEALFFFRNAKTLVPVAQAKGVILEACASRGIVSFEYTPMQVKLTLTGFGRADKRLVQETVARVLEQARIITPDDAADGVALAICHARQALRPDPLPAL